MVMETKEKHSIYVKMKCCLFSFLKIDGVDSNLVMKHISSTLDFLTILSYALTINSNEWIRLWGDYLLTWRKEHYHLVK